MCARIKSDRVVVLWLLFLRSPRSPTPAPPAISQNSPLWFGEPYEYVCALLRCTLSHGFISVYRGSLLCARSPSLQRDLRALSLSLALTRGSAGDWWHATPKAQSNSGWSHQHQRAARSLRISRTRAARSPTQAEPARVGMILFTSQHACVQPLYWCDRDRAVVFWFFLFVRRFLLRGSETREGRNVSRLICQRENFRNYPEMVNLLAECARRIWGILVLPDGRNVTFPGGDPCL